MCAVTGGEGPRIGVVGDNGLETLFPPVWE